MNRLTCLPLAFSLAAAPACAPAPPPGSGAVPSAAGLSAAPLDVPPAGSDDTLRYAGIYQSREESGYPAWNYLRFYHDSTVVNTLTPGEPHQLSNLSVANEMLPYGRASVRGNRLSFSIGHYGIVSEGFFVDYSGYIQGDRLYLHEHSHYNGHQSNRVYTFIPMDTRRLDSPPRTPPE